MDIDSSTSELQNEVSTLISKSDDIPQKENISIDENAHTMEESFIQKIENNFNEKEKNLIEKSVLMEKNVQEEEENANVSNQEYNNQQDENNDEGDDDDDDDEDASENEEEDEENFTDDSNEHVNNGNMKEKKLTRSSSTKIVSASASSNASSKQNKKTAKMNKPHWLEEGACYKCGKLHSHKNNAIVFCSACGVAFQ